MSENPERTSTSTGPLWNHEITDENMILRLAALHEAYALLDPYVAEEVNSVDAIELACFIITGRTLSKVEAEVELPPTLSGMAPYLEKLRQELKVPDDYKIVPNVESLIQAPETRIPGELECEETDYDNRGDCDGLIFTYKTRAFILGHRPEESIALCNSHAKQRRGGIDPEPCLPVTSAFAPKIERKS